MSNCPVDTCPEWVRLNAEAVRLGDLANMSLPSFNGHWAVFCEAHRLTLKHLYSPHKEGT